jgi:nicotinamide mononucleotide transporter
VIGIWLYFIKDVKFISLLYVMLLFMAIRGFVNWISVKAKVPDKKGRQGKGSPNKSVEETA